MLSDDGTLVPFTATAIGNANGDFVAFDSFATTLRAPRTPNPVASTSADGDQGFGNSTNAAISGNGWFVAFQSAARLLGEDFDHAPFTSGTCRAAI